MKRAFLLALATASLVACSSPEFSARRVGGDIGARTGDELLAEGRFNFRNGNFALAAASFRRALRQAPQSVDAYNGLAASYDRLGRFDLARRYYEEALALAPTDPRVRHNYAISLRMQGMTREAMAIETELPSATEVATVDPSAIAAADPVATVPADSVTIMLPPTPPPAAAPTVAPLLPRLDYAMPRLERMSTGEVALITRPQAARPAPAEVAARAPARVAPPVRVATTLRALPLPVRVVRDTSQQVVMQIGAAPQAFASNRAPVRILNAVGRRGQAGRMQAHLRAQGWNPASVGDATIRRGRSFMLARPGGMREAEALARTLPFRPRVFRSTRIRQTMLFLGRDALSFDDRLRRGPAQS